MTTIGGQSYITFVTSSFSPFVLVYEGEGSSSTSSGTTRYTLTYESNGGTEYNSERYRRNTVVELDKTPIREGYTFTGWYADKDLEGDPITEIKMTSSKTVYAGWEVTFVPNWLNGDDHFAYIIGRDSGLVEPQSSITRAEVATIFFRLLKDDVRAENLTESNAFTDVAADMWYNTAISTMAKMGILEGDPDGSFRPDDNITRAEFAAIAARFSDGSYEGADIFDDIADHWARNEINLAASVGWIAGYENGSFRAAAHDHPRRGDDADQPRAPAPAGDRRRPAGRYDHLAGRSAGSLVLSGGTGSDQQPRLRPQGRRRA